MNLSIIVVNYNVYKHLVNCINSVISTVKNDLTYEIIVVDNNSTERLIDDLCNEFPSVKLIKMHHNIGFGGANNEALKVASGDFFLIINPDIIVSENCIQSLYKFLSSNKRVGVAAPALYLPDGKYDYYYSFLPSVYSIIMQQFGLYSSAGKMKNRMFSFFDKNIPVGKPIKVEQVMGACFMTRKEIYNTLGGFDDIYFLYQEETDWEFRMTRAGWEIMILPEAKAVHDHHSSANKLGKIYVGYQGIRSIIIYYTKNFDFLKRNLLRLTMIAALGVRGLKYLFIYLTSPKNLIESWKYTFRLLVMSLKPRKYVLNSRYEFDI